MALNDGNRLSAEDRHRLLESENMQCSMCLEPFRNAVTTSCGHTYCAECILTYWQTKDVDEKIDCPQDRVRVSLIVPNFVIRSELSKIDRKFSHDNSKWDRILDQYNNKFTNAPRAFGDQIREDVAILQRASHESSTMRYIIIAIMIGVFLYTILPMDLIPDEMGLIGLLDDITIFVLVMFVLYNIAESYRRSLIAERDQQQQRQ